MRALVLAAGRGERLKPLTEKIPKPLLEVGGRPLIHYPLLMLRQGGIREIAINVHHRASEIEASLGSGEGLGLKITYAPEPMLLGTGGPLRALRAYFGDRPFAIANADTILGLDLARMIEFHRERRALATIALNQPPNLDSYSRLEVDNEGMIRRMRLLTRDAGRLDEYPPNLAAAVSESLRSFMYCGICVCESVVLELTPATPPFSLMADVLGPMVAKGMRVAGYIHQGVFRTVDDLASYERLRE
jgi:NDP-sugar pyrophosphorylase family protein